MQLLLWICAWPSQLRLSLEGSAFIAVTAFLYVVMTGSEGLLFQSSWMFFRVGRLAICCWHDSQPPAQKARLAALNAPTCCRKSRRENRLRSSIFGIFGTFGILEPPVRCEVGTRSRALASSRVLIAASRDSRDLTKSV